MTRTQQINVRFKTTDQTDESTVGAGSESQVFLLLFIIKIF